MNAHGYRSLISAAAPIGSQPPSSNVRKRIFCFYGKPEIFYSGGGECGYAGLHTGGAGIVPSLSMPALRARSLVFPEWALSGASRRDILNEARAFFAAGVPRSFRVGGKRNRALAGQSEQIVSRAGARPRRGLHGRARDGGHPYGPRAALPPAVVRRVEAACRTVCKKAMKGDALKGER